MQDDSRDGPDPNRPFEEFGDGEFTFRFFVLPAGASINLQRGTELDGDFTQRAFNEVTSAVADRVSLRRDPRWKVVLLRTRKDAWLAHPPVVMVEFVASEAAGVARVEELVRQWHTGRDFVNVEPVSFKQLRAAVRRTRPNLGPVSLAPAATRSDRPRRQLLPERKWEPGQRPGDLSTRTRIRIVAAALMVGAFITTRPGGPLIYIPFTLGVGVLVYGIFTWLYRSNDRK